MNSYCDGKTVSQIDGTNQTWAKGEIVETTFFNVLFVRNSR